MKKTILGISLLMTSLGLNAQSSDELLDITFDGNFNDQSSVANTIIERKNSGSTGISYVTDRFGNPNNAAYFSGSHYLDVTSESNFDNLPAYSISFFAKADNITSTEQVIIAKVTSGRDFVVEYDRNGRFRANHMESGTGLLFVVDPTISSTNAWHHVAYTYDGATFSIYVDGTLAASRPVISTPNGAGNNMTIGAFDTGYLHFTGCLDNMKVFDRALTATEVSNINSATPILDNDNDGIANNSDNCPNTPNSDQFDSDDDGFGDVCDTDLDGDLVDNNADNCPNIHNADQYDIDGDGFGDVCDIDLDGDLVDNNADNCPNTHNADQYDVDGDGFGDVCDTDLDGDLVDNNVDNCPNTYNADQLDSDLDGLGDVCDLCDGDDDIDNDGVCNTADNCSMLVNSDQLDSDGDGYGDVCDLCYGDNTDTDNDGVCDIEDNCLNSFNPLQDDIDNNNIGDACELIENKILGVSRACAEQGPYEFILDESAATNISWWTSSANAAGPTNQVSVEFEFPVWSNSSTVNVGYSAPTYLTQSRTVEIVDCSDTDGDLIMDINDNCPLVPNPDQNPMACSNAISGPSEVCQGQSYIFTMPYVSGATYSWWSNGSPITILNSNGNQVSMEIPVWANAPNISVGINWPSSPWYTQETLSLSIGTCGSAKIGDNGSEVSASINVYPNPFNSTINISSLSDETLEVIIYNTIGLEVLRTQVQGSASSIDSSGLPSGSYICKVISSESTTETILIKQ